MSQAKKRRISLGDVMVAEADLTCVVCKQVPRECNLLFCNPRHHPLCEQCKEEGGGGLGRDKSPCPGCAASSQRVDWTRDSLRDRILDRWEFQCRFADRGCEYVGTRWPLYAHYDDCCHGVFPCPIRTCDNAVDMAATEMSGHVDESHAGVRRLSGSGPHVHGFVNGDGGRSLDLDSGRYSPGAVVSFDGEKFLFDVNCYMGILCAHVSLLGTGDGAERYAASVSRRDFRLPRGQAPVKKARFFGKEYGSPAALRMSVELAKEAVVTTVWPPGEEEEEHKQEEREAIFFTFKIKKMKSEGDKWRRVRNKRD